MTNQELEAIQKRTVAVHEAGHLTVALAEGCRARALIKPNENHGEFERSWVGECERMGVGPVTPSIALAGTIAEYLDRDGLAEAGFVHMAIEESIEIEFESFSLSDREAFPPNDQLYPVVKITIGTLREHRAFHEWATDTLLREGTITDSQATEEWERFRREVENA